MMNYHYTNITKSSSNELSLHQHHLGSGNALLHEHHLGSGNELSLHQHHLQYIFAK